MCSTVPSFRRSSLTFFCINPIGTFGNIDIFISSVICLKGLILIWCVGECFECVPNCILSENSSTICRLVITYTFKNCLVLFLQFQERTVVVFPCFSVETELELHILCKNFFKIFHLFFFRLKKNLFQFFLFSFCKYPQKSKSITVCVCVVQHKTVSADLILSL